MYIFLSDHIWLCVNHVIHTTSLQNIPRPIFPWWSSWWKKTFYNSKCSLKKRNDKKKELKSKMLLSWLPFFFLTRMGLENGVRKYIKVKVSKKEFRLQSPLAFVSMSVWTMWLARNMPLTKIWLLTFQARIDFLLQLYLNINRYGF